MRPVRPIKRSFLRQCAHDVLDIAGCGLLWLLLGGLALLQGWLLVVGELQAPDFLRDRLQGQLAERGLRADYDRVRVDPTGRLLVERPRIAPHAGGDPLLSAHQLLVRLDPWALLTGEVRVESVEGFGLNLYLPALLSPSGRAEAVLADAQFRVRFGSGGPITLDGVSGHIAGLRVALDGRLTLPALKPRAPGARAMDPTAHFPLARRLITIGDQLRPLGELSVRGRFSPDGIALTARAPRIDLSRIPASPLVGATGEALNATLRLSLPFDLEVAPVASASLETLALSLPDMPALQAGDVQARLTGAVLADWRDWSAFTLDATAATLSAAPLELAATGLHARILPDGRLHAGALTRLDAQPWRIDYRGRTDDAVGTVELEARPTAGLLAGLDPLLPLPIPLTTLLALGPPPRLSASVELAPGGRPVRASGRLSGGGAVAYRVPIDEASAEFAWEGTTLAFTDILLRLNRSEARGSYTMDLGSRDFRFLLNGRLDPPDIGGWFGGWWATFWSDFTFGSPAEADVEVRGRWGDPLGTTVFVAAQARGAALRGQELAELRTRLFIRPGWYDALDFHAVEPGGGVADGRFGLTVGLGGEGLQSIDFDFTSTLPTGALVRLLGPGAEPVFAPYVFSRPPRIVIAGRADLPAHRALRFHASTDQPFSFAGFGGESIDVHGEVKDDLITLEPMQAGVAGGLLRGRAVITGAEGARRLSLDHELAAAKLDTVLDLLAARRADAEAETAQGEPRRPGGLLDLTFKAEGPLDQPVALQGGGRARITGAHFAEINLLGLLSEVFKSTGLGFTSLALEQLTTSYELKDGVLRFPDLRLSGPSAVIDATGRYQLADSRLDFRAKLFPYEGQRGMIGSAADFVLSPLSKALEFRLEGTLEQPDWSFAYGPRGWLRGLTGENLPEAPVTKPDEPATP